MVEDGDSAKGWINALHKILKAVYCSCMKKGPTMMDIFKNPRYRGKHVILAAGKIYTAKTGEGAAEILRKLEKTHAEVVPEVAYLPKAHSLILRIWM